MKEEERKRIIEILESGEMLSSEWSSVVFPNQKRECELVYDGKAREEDILAETMSVPLQQTRRFGNNGNGWHNKLVFGDNLQVMRSLLEEKRSGSLRNADGTPGIRLVYIDPPFSTKKEMQGISGAQAYQDKLAAGEFLEFLRKRLILIRELLSDDGSIYVHLDWRMNSYVRVLMDEVFGKENFVNHISWKRYAPHSLSKSGFDAITDTIFIYAKNRQQITFNPQFSRICDVEQKFPYIEKETGRHYQHVALEQSSNESSRGESRTIKGKTVVSSIGWRWTQETFNNRLKTNTHLIHWTGKGRPRYKIYADEYQGSPLGDNWSDINYLSSGDKQSLDYPTQKPEALLERILKTSSDNSDIVADFFLGSGTTVAVAEKLERRWIGCDCGKLAIYTTQKRMLNLRKEIGNKGPVLQPKPFALFNAGLYELEKPGEEPRENWRRFVLQLFQCLEEIHEIGGIRMDGKLRGKSVLVYEPQNVNNELITEETIQELHSNVGRIVGGHMFLIAPAMSFGFFQDYIDYDGVRYYALRIPYSIINELHRRDFTALRQPENETAVNETVDAVGFDFNRRPKLKYSVGVKKLEVDSFESAFIKIETFKSEARIPQAKRMDGNRETLSMLMLDYDYDSAKGIFEFDEVFYANALSKEGWTVFFSYENLGENIMAIFIDVYGNEARELISVKSFDSLPLECCYPENRGKRTGKRYLFAKSKHFTG